MTAGRRLRHAHRRAQGQVPVTARQEVLDGKSACRGPAVRTVTRSVSRRRQGIAGGVAGCREGPEALGPGLLPLDRRRREPVARLAGNRSRPVGARRAVRAPHRRGKARRLLARDGARDGRLQPLPRGPGDHFRPYRRLAAASRAGLHRPRSHPLPREPDRSGPHLVYRVQQVRHHPGAEHLQAVFLPAGERNDRRGGGGPPLHRHHRPRLEAAAGGGKRPVPSHFPRRAQHRRAVLGALSLRHGPRRRYGPGRPSFPRPR
jgi:hypothetical protein